MKMLVTKLKFHAFSFAGSLSIKNVLHIAAVSFRWTQIILWDQLEWITNASKDKGWRRIPFGVVDLYNSDSEADLNNQKPFGFIQVKTRDKMQLKYTRMYDLDLRERETFLLSIFTLFLSIGGISKELFELFQWSYVEKKRRVEDEQFRVQLRQNQSTAFQNCATQANWEAQLKIKICYVFICGLANSQKCPSYY